MAKKSNWSRVSRQRYTDTAQGRDVYNEQQLERGHLQEKQTMTSRLIFAIILSLLAGFLVYVVWAFLGPAIADYKATSTETCPHVDENLDDICDICNCEGVSSDPNVCHHVDNDESGYCDACGINIAEWEAAQQAPQQQPQQSGNSGSSGGGGGGWFSDLDWHYDTGEFSGGGGPGYSSSTSGDDGTSEDNPEQGETKEESPYKQEIHKHAETGQIESVDYYDKETGKHVRHEHFNEYGVITGAEVYDEDGNIIEIDTYDENGILIRTDYYDLREKVLNKEKDETTEVTDETVQDGTSEEQDGQVEESETLEPSENQTEEPSEADDDTESSNEESSEESENETIVVDDNVDGNDGNSGSNGPKEELTPEEYAKKYPAGEHMIKVATAQYNGEGVMYRKAYWDETELLVTHIDYYNGELVSNTEFYTEWQTIERIEYYREDKTIMKIVYYNLEKNVPSHTEYYDYTGKLTQTIIHHGRLYPVSKSQILWSICVTVITFLALYEIFKRNLAAQNMLANTDDINQYSNDQHIALPEEIQRKYDWFPDVGAHSSVLVSSMISHMSLKNKGVKKIMVAKRYAKDVVNENGDVVYYKGDIIRDSNGEAILEEMPMFDEAFSDALFEASGAPKEVRFSYDPHVIPYNPDNKNREKLQGKEDSKKLFDKLIAKITGKKIKQVSKYDYVTDLINKDWEFPEYETQRPAGAYIVDTAPVNTMVLAITRAGKGQTVIEPTIDMWTREKRGNNMVINDPKGELLVKNYVRGATRGFQIVQFNLINAMKTDIYNPLGMAAQSAREGDFTKCAMYVENIAEVFFPLDGGDDPVWPNAANNAFKRAAYGLIDYYLEEERKYRNECNLAIAKGKYIDPQVIETNIDSMWGKVTLYNCYQMFTQLTSKKIPNPAKEFAQKMKSGGFEGVPEEEIAAEAERANIMSDIWAGAPEADCLTLYFNATERLPKNSMRTLVENVNNALKSMAGAEKMMASVYGIAITAMVRDVA